MAGTTPTEPGASLVRTHRATILLLGVCALLSWQRSQDASELSQSVDAVVLPTALALAMGIMAARQVALRSRSPRSRRVALLVTYGLCASLGIFGAALAFAGDSGSRGALFALGAAIFTLGSPPRPGIFATP